VVRFAVGWERTKIGDRLGKDSALICGWPDFGGNDNYESEIGDRRSAARGETTGSLDGPRRNNSCAFPARQFPGEAEIGRRVTGNEWHWWTCLGRR
jgi:hypothetical protein